MYNINKIKENILKLSRMSESEWDAICANCGVCCLHKIDVDGTVYFSKYACSHCDLKNKLCTRYNERFNDGHCTKVNLIDVISGNYLPDNCAYAEFIFGPAKNTPNIDWCDVKKDPTSFNKIKKNIFPDSDTWALRTQSDIIPELLEFIKNLKI